MTTKFDIDADMVRKLAELLQETGLNEIEYAEGEKRIRLHRAPPVVQQSIMQMPHAMTVGAPAAIAAQPASAPESVGNAHANAVTSPMVGTAYLSSEPGAKPFVSVGDTVKAGDTLLIIEAMKVMNPIKATAGGVVKEILIRDGKPVEFGEALMIVA